MFANLKPKDKSKANTFRIPSIAKYKPINGYGVIGNTRTVSLVGFDGSIDWCCMPKFDSPSIFAAILDNNLGGSWKISPAGVATSTQRYVENTNILQTEFATDDSKALVTDFMPCSLGDHAWAAPPEIHRIVQCTSGDISMRMSISPRFDYGRFSPKIVGSRQGLSVKNHKDEMALASTTEFRILEGGIAQSEFKLAKGESETFILSYGEYEPREIQEYETGSQLLRTEAFWKDWVGRLKYKGRWQHAVLRSALILRLLVYSPTGAIVAAPTMSLPEAIGGNRNWDYRYSWIRDSANSLWAFHVLGDKSQTERYLHWLIDNNPSLDLDLRLMYSIDGDSKITESTLDYLEGYLGSAPVQIGNAAFRQAQMDVYGYMLDALHFSSVHGTTVTDEMYFRFVKPLAHRICNSWMNPGNGIWEIRGKREHYVYTVAWCYVGLKRAVEIARSSGHRRDTNEWLSTMEKIRNDVLSKGWDEKKQSFVMSYETRQVDASALILPLIGFISANDKKMLGTMRAVTKYLGAGPLIYRYRINDRLQGKEGAFLLCSFWMVACLARAGRVEEAEEMFEKLLGYANHVGLYAEEIDPATGAGLGNFPQAFSHMGLIMAAHELDKAIELD